MKVRPDSLDGKDRIRYLDALYTAAGSLRGRADIKSFLRDLLTMSERIMMGRRITIARMVLAGRSYGEIMAELSVGKDTVHRVHRWLVDQYPGYEKALAGLEKELSKRERKRSIDYTTIIAKLKKKYPIRFLLFPWPRKKKLV